MTRRDEDKGGGSPCFAEAVLEQYLSGVVDGPKRDEIGRHLDRCEVCRGFVDDLAAGEQMGALLREARSELPAELRFRLIGASTTAILAESRHGAAASREERAS